MYIQYNYMTSSGHACLIEEFKTFYVPFYVLRIITCDCNEKKTRNCDRIV